jgi:uncharacterized SAM-binding protein YcdF (DUF218 family)
MRSFITDLVHILISLPLYFFIFFIILQILAYRKKHPVFYPYRYLLTAITLLIYLYSASIFPTLLTAAYEHTYEPLGNELTSHPDKQNLIIVLTSGWYRAKGEDYEMKIGEAGWERITSAVHLWQRIGGHILVSGAPAPIGVGSIAAAMAEQMTKMGISREAILVEGKSRNTYQNLLFSKEMIKTPEQYNIILLTSAMHMPRAMLVARQLDLDVIPYPCDFRADTGFNWQGLVPSNEGPQATEKILHELLGYIYYWLRDRT